MSRPTADTSKRRARRQITDEFKAGVVRLVLDHGKTVGAVARAAYRWVRGEQQTSISPRTSPRKP